MLVSFLVIVLKAASHRKERYLLEHSLVTHWWHSAARVFSSLSSFPRALGLLWWVSVGPASSLLAWACSCHSTFVTGEWRLKNGMKCAWVSLLINLKALLMSLLPLETGVQNHYVWPRGLGDMFRKHTFMRVCYKHDGCIITLPACYTVLQELQGPLLEIPLTSHCLAKLRLLCFAKHGTIQYG